MERVLNKIFSMRTLLSVTTGRLLTKPRGQHNNGIEDIYELVEHMTGEPAFTHQLPRFIRECRPVLLKLFPDLEKADVSELDKLEPGIDSVEQWLKRCEEEWEIPTRYSLSYGYVKNHISKGPVTELYEMLGNQPETN